MAEKLSSLDRLEIEIMEAADHVRKRHHQHDMGYASGLRRAQFLLTEHINALANLVASQAELIETQKVLLAERHKEG